MKTKELLSVGLSVLAVVAIVALSGVLHSHAPASAPAPPGPPPGTAGLGGRPFNPGRTVTLGHGTYRATRAVSLRGGGAKIGLGIGPQLGSAHGMSVTLGLIAWSLGPSTLYPRQCAFTMRQWPPPPRGTAPAATSESAFPPGRSLPPQRMLKMAAGFGQPDLPDEVTTAVSVRLTYAASPGGPERVMSGRFLMERHAGYWEWLTASASPPPHAKQSQYGLAQP